jgi:hypothetical protein
VAQHGAEDGGERVRVRGGSSLDHGHIRQLLR